MWQLTDRTKRPPFRQVSPIVYWSSWSFSIMNIVFLTPAFFVSQGSSGLALVGIIPSPVWGFIFLGIGMTMIIGLVRNRWNIIRAMLVFGLLIKAMFAWALVFTLFTSFANIGVIGVWLGMMVWQGLCIVYFTPEMKYASNI